MFLSCIESSIFRTTIQSTLKQCLCVSHAKRKFMSVRMIASDAKAGVTPSSQRESEPIAASNLLHHNTPKPTPLKIGAYDAKHDWSSTKNGCVFSIPKSAYEKLDTMGSITTQKKPFSFFDKPALLQRNITSTIVDILQRRTEFNSRDARYIIDGEPGSGRSVALIQAQLYAFQQPNILLLAVNNCDFWTNSTSAYEFEENSQQWIQPNLTASFLKPILEVNGNLLKKMALSNIPSDTPSALQNVSHLHDLLSIGVKNTTAAPAVLKLFFQQLQQLHLVDNAPVQILLTVDNLSIFTVPTRYKDPENKPIHPFNFQFINMIMEFLSGKRYFEHGTVLAATSSRPQVSTPSLNQALGKKAPNPYANLDDRVLQTLKEVNVLQSEPYSLEEARALMTYFVEANVCLESLDKHQQNYVLSGGNPRQFFHHTTSLQRLTVPKLDIKSKNDLVTESNASKKLNIFQLLSNFYPHILTLNDYTALSNPSLNENDLYHKHKDYLLSTIVCFQSPLRPPCENNSVRCSQTEVLDNVILWHFQHSKNKPNNILTRGYLANNERYKATHFSSLNSNVVIVFPNDYVSIFRSERWQDLLKLMGEAMMSYLLTFGSIYVHLPGKNYVQLCGVPLCDVPVLSRTEDVRKKRKTRPWPDAPKSQKKPNSRESISKKVSIRQILFTMNPTNSSPNYSVGFDKNYPLSISRPRPLHKRSLYVLCLMFPKQIPSSHESSGSIKGKTDSQHSSFSDFVIPKRLNSAYSMIRQLLKRYDKTSYQELYQYYCPFPKDAIAKREASTSITDFSVGSHQVYAFVKAVLKRVIPKNFWGSTANFQHLLKAVKFFINLRRYDVLNLDHVLLDIKIKDIRWLELPSTKGCRMSLTDFNKRKEIFAEFVHWLFSSFVMNLLQTSFYATESSGQRNKIYFFRRDVFHDLSEPFCHDIRNRLFEPVDANELDEKLHVASIRLLPKRNTFRLIVNLSRKLQLKESFTKETTFRSSSTNTMLLPLATILGWKTKLLSKKEAVYTTLADVYTELINYKARLSRVDMMNCKKYFVKVDIRNCYDCIDQKKLLRIVRTLFDEDEFLIRKYAIVRACYENFVKKYALSACTYADYLNFFQFAMQFKGRRDCQVFIDNVDSQTRTTDELMLLLKQHITQHTVSFGNGCYRQTQGIPQGSKISNTLCFFYTRDLVRKRLRFVNKGNSVLLRVVDDFLFITTRKRDAKRFLSLMVKGFPDYNFYVNEDKTMVNFDPGPKYLNKIKIASDELLFCGFRVNLRDLSIGRELYIQSSAHRRIITVEHASCIWQVLCKRLMGTVFSSLHPIFLNASHNSPSAIRYNVYTVAHNTAFRLRQYIHEYKLLPINVHDIVSKVWFVLSTRFRVYSLGVVNSSKPESLQFTSAEMKWLIIQGALDALRPVKQLAAFTLSLSREQKRLEKKIPVMYLRQCVSSRRFRAINLR